MSASAVSARYPAAPSANNAVAHANTPVSTGYSISPAPSSTFTSSPSRCSVCTSPWYGRTCSSMLLEYQSVWMSL